MKVYGAYCNADMTEGRGPMVLRRVFLYKHLAENWINAQEGIMGRRARWAEDPGDWRLEEIEVIEYDLLEAERHEFKRREELLASLSEDDKRILGIK